MPSPAERAELLRVSRMLPGLVGLGAKDWEPWVADEVAT